MNYSKALILPLPFVSNFFQHFSVVVMCVAFFTKKNSSAFKNPQIPKENSFIIWTNVERFITFTTFSCTTCFWYNTSNFQWGRIKMWIIVLLPQINLFILCATFSIYALKKGRNARRWRRVNIIIKVINKCFPFYKS